MDKKKLGILGGMGPMASVYFYELITRHTRATCDSEHIDLVICSHAKTPDRTAFITGASADSPEPVLINDVKMLASAGCEVIAITCNTAHSFYDRIAACTGDAIRILHMPRDAVRYLTASGTKKVGLLATDGTLASRIYQNECERHGLPYAVPTEKMQRAVMNIVYGSVKSGKSVGLSELRPITDELAAAGCDRFILGCTELSVVRRDLGPDSATYVDPMEILAYRAIVSCGYAAVGYGEYENAFR